METDDGLTREEPPSHLSAIPSQQKTSLLSAPVSSCCESDLSSGSALDSSGPESPRAHARRKVHNKKWSPSTTRFKPNLSLSPMPSHYSSPVLSSTFDPVGVGEKGERLSIISPTPRRRRSSVALLSRRPDGASTTDLQPYLKCAAQFHVAPEVCKLVHDQSCRVEAFKYLRSMLDERHALPQWRQDLIALTESKGFNRVVLCLILLNCVFLALEDPTADNSTVRNQMSLRSEYVFAACFFIEMMIKIVGMGLYEKSFSYLRDPWNVLDGIIVVSAATTIVFELVSGTDGSSGGAISGLRALRLLRPLRAASKFKQVHIIMNSLVQSVPQLADVMLLYMSFLLIMGIMAVRLWRGQLATRCFDLSATPPLIEPQQRVCTSNLDRLYSYKCPWGYTCIHYENPGHGKTSFDNIGVAFLTLFTALTLEGWTETMYAVVDATTPFASLYFIFIIMVGTFFIINLTLAIVNTSFEGNVKVQNEHQNEASFREVESMRIQDELKKIATSTDQAAQVIDIPEVQDSEFTVQSQVLITLQSLRERLRSMILSYRFAWLVMLMILLNTIVLMTRFSNQPDGLTDLQDVSNYIFTFIFLTESLVKIIALSPSEFFGDKFNVFDVIIVIISLLDLFVISGSVGASAFRSFRLMRFLSQFPDLYRFMKTLEHSLVGASVLTVLLLLVIFIYALLGMQFFGGKFCDLDLDTLSANGTDGCTNIPRENFDTLWESLLTVFKIVTAEDWNLVMYNGMRSTSNAAALYFTTLVVIGNYMVLNLFVAVLFSGLASAGEEEEDPMDQLLEQPPPLLSTVCCCCQDSVSKIRSKPNSELTKRRESTYSHEPEPEDSTLKEAENILKASSGIDRTNILDPSNRDKETIERNIQWLLTNCVVKDAQEGRLLWDRVTEVAEKEKQRQNAAIEQLRNVELQIPTTLAPVRRASVLSAIDKLMLSPEDEAPGSVPPRAVYQTYQNEQAEGDDDSQKSALSSSNSFRANLRAVCESRAFEATVIVIVLFSSATLTLEDPLAPPDTKLPRILAIIDIVVTSLFSFEAFLKIIAYGFIMKQTSYLRRDPWNRLDFFIVVCGITTVVLNIIGVSKSAVDAFEVVRMMRSLRPLRAVAKIKGMRIVLESLMAAIPSLSHVFILSFMILTIFGITGVHFFAGKFGACTHYTWGDMADYVTEAECQLAGYRWQSHPSNFDNLGNAVLTLFEIATLEGWIEVTNLGIDATEEGQLGERNHNPVMALYFVVFIVVGAFFLVNLFTGVLVDQYDRQQRILEESSSTPLTLDQAEWKGILDAVTKNIKPFHRQADLGPFRLALYRAILHRRVDEFIMVCIVLNTAAMALEHDGQSEAWDDALYVVNVFFISLFGVEVVLKIIAMSPRGYFQDPWDKFDFSVFVIACVGLFVTGPALSLFRVLRLARLLRAVRIAKGIRTLIRTLMLSLPGLVNVAGLLLILFFLYAVVGVKVFAKIQRGAYITDQANFDNFKNAMLLLVRMTTGEAWQGVMHDCQVATEPSCDPHLASCGSPYGAPFYFVSFMLLGTFIILNLIIAVILEDFFTAQAEEANLLTAMDVHNFTKTWKTYDPSGTATIPTTRLPGFLKAVPPPLGLGGSKKPKDISKIVSGLYETPDGRVEFRSVIIQCATVLFHREVTDADVSLPPETQAVFDKRWSEIVPFQVPCTSTVEVSQSLAAMKIQSLWRGRVARLNFQHADSNKLKNVLTMARVAQRMRSGHEPQDIRSVSSHYISTPGNNPLSPGMAPNDSERDPRSEVVVSPDGEEVPSPPTSEPPSPPPPPPELSIPPPPELVIPPLPGLMIPPPQPSSAIQRDSSEASDNIIRNVSSAIGTTASVTLEIKDSDSSGGSEPTVAAAESG
eukprot:TRINITY_DN4105_c1_g2_i1.p1 TRINITY_DN4105_c1_g2~~TRINITY_DN4105_c1_g2_i1.p1  ORF type:complete len:1864 (+),score=261.13 TRINITY_DN4105_c1_g2_i1:89-5680(+)